MDETVAFDLISRRAVGGMIDGVRNRIMIVEDNIEMSDFLKTLLCKDYDTVAVFNGKEALELLKKEIPDLILSDVMMPEMDGIDMTYNIRSDRKYDSVPIILLSGNTDITDRNTGLEKGANEYITKPFDPMDLIASIRAHLKFKV